MTPSLRELSLPLRALFTSFLLLMGIGYLMALSYLFLVDVEPHQKMGMGLVSGIAMKYHGDASGTRLEAALRGSMAGQISDDERERIIRWIRAGAPEAGYPTIKPILDKNCVSCHSARSGLPVPLLDSLPELRKVIQIDTGPSIAQLARISHVHLFGIGIIFLLTGIIFAMSDTPVWFRVSLLVLPYLGIVADIGSWWLTKGLPAFGIDVLIGGAIIGLSMGVQILVSLWQMWLPALRSGPVR